MRFSLILLVLLVLNSHVVRGFAQAVATPVAPKTSQEAESGHQAKPEANSEDTVYVRIHETDAGRPDAMQTAIVRFQGKSGTKYSGQIVDLVGVVHIGEEEYYQDLGQRLALYEKVLYELVAPDGTRIRPEDLQKRRSMLASLQGQMKDMLNLEYQLEKIDYMSTNFRHADMSPEEFTADMEKHGDSIWKMVARMMGAGIASQARTGGDVGMMLAMVSDDRSKMLKQTMARQLVDIDLVTAGMDDANGDNTLIKGRNGKAFRILRDELDSGTKDVAVFYGAGHLPDMAKRLEEEFDMEAGQTTWLKAWDLTRN